MIDYVKLKIPFRFAIALMERFEFIIEVNEQTGELGKIKRANWEGLEFKIIQDKHLYLSGSLHKSFQQGRNCNDYSFSDLIATLQNLTFQTGIPLKELRIENIEIGLNLRNIPLPPDQLIKSFLAYKGTTFESMESKKRKVSLGRKCILQRFEIKIYNKGKQYKLNEEVLRIELKFKKMKDLNDGGLFNLSDLLANVNILQYLKDKLLSTFSNIVTIDNRLKTARVTQKERTFIDLASNRDYWKGKIKKSNKVRFKALHKRYIGQTYQDNLKDLLELKWNEIVISPIQFEPKVTGLLKPELTQSNPSISMLLPAIPPYTKRECKTCGRDISNQKKGSLFCSESLYGPIAKKCRNMNSNPRNGMRKKLERIISEPSLYDLRILLEPAKERISLVGINLNEMLKGNC
jgi:hypothetical protein